MYDYICLYARTSEATLQRYTPPTTEVWYAHNSVDDAESALSKVLFVGGMTGLGGLENVHGIYSSKYLHS